MDNKKTISIEIGIITTIKLDRREVHNAMNEQMIEELTNAFADIPQDKNIRLIILRGEGKSFCAGADLNYMKGIAKYGYAENYEDGLKLASLFKEIYSCPIPTMAVVHGAAFGGANGLISACDIVIAEENTTFAFSEVKLGIGPATISPFVIKRIGEFNAKDLMLTGRRFKAPEALMMGLISKCVSKDEMDQSIQSYVREFASSAPKAVRFTKDIINNVMNQNLEIGEEIKYTASCIAKLRNADEGLEGMSAFLEKRKPNWVVGEN